MYLAFRYNNKRIMQDLGPMTLITNARDTTEAKNIFEASHSLVQCEYNPQTGNNEPVNPADYTTVVQAVTEAQ